MNDVDTILARAVKLVRAVAHCGSWYGCHNLFLGHNALICAHRYKISINDVNIVCVINANFLLLELFHEFYVLKSFWSKSPLQSTLFPNFSTSVFINSYFGELVQDSY